MKKIVLISVLLMLVGCASYKLETEFAKKPTGIEQVEPDQIEIVKMHEYAKGWQCFEPMLFALTLGVVPTHCVEEYSISLNGENLGSAKLTLMSGWVPLVMPILPKWKFGGDPDINSVVAKKLNKN